jgi:hypothetical protein
MKKIFIGFLIFCVLALLWKIGFDLKKKACVLKVVQKAPSEFQEIFKNANWKNVNSLIARLQVLAELKESQWEEREIMKFMILRARIILKECGIEY